jgi:putative membrane protein
MYLIARWLVAALAVMAAAYLVPGIIVSGFYAALWVALVLGILNAIVRPILFLLTLPITVVTLGLFIFILNALLFWFVASVVKGFEVSGFGPALVGSLVVTVLSWVANQFFFRPTPNRIQQHQLR